MRASMPHKTGNAIFNLQSLSVLAISLNMPRKKEGRTRIIIAILPTIHKQLKALAKKAGSIGKAVESKFEEDSK